MSSGNGLATREQATAIAPPQITADQMALITKTVAKDATPDELKLIRMRLKDIAAETINDPGFELNLHFDLPRTEPRGKVLRRTR